VPIQKTAGKPVPTDATPPASDGLSPQARAVLDDFRLDHIASHLLRRAHFLAEDLFSAEFSGESLTPRQKAALVVIAQRPGLTQSALAEHLCMDRNTIAEMVKRLCANGLLVRSSAKEDRRAYQLNIGAKGVALLNRILPRDACVEAALLEPLPAKDRPLFLRYLRLIVEHRRAANGSIQQDRQKLPRRHTP